MKIFSVWSFLVVAALGTVGCVADDLIESFNQSADPDSVWVYAQFNLPEKDGIEDYYYYGRISENLYRDFIDNKIDKGIIVLRDVSYWNNDDVIEKFEDDRDSGTLVFRIEHIVYMRLQKGDPLLVGDAPEAE